jgi:hypothetical protein
MAGKQWTVTQSSEGKLAIFGGKYEEESLDRSKKVTWDGEYT